MSRDELERQGKIELAGRIAEKLLLGTGSISKDTCSYDDKSKAFYIAKLCCLDGIDETHIARSKAVQEKLIDDAYELIHSWEQKIQKKFTKHKDLIQFIADGLEKFESMDAEMLQEFINLHKVLDGRSIEDFLKELEQEAQEGSQEDAKQNNSADEQASDEQPVEQSEDTIEETKKAVEDELDLQEVTQEK